jgi:chromosome segregation ATPase
LHEELGDEESLLGKDGTPLPLPIDTQETMGLIDIEQWLGTSLKHYKQTLSECLPHIDKEMDVVPKLLQGLLDEAQNGTQELAKLLKRVQKEIKTSPSNPNPKELEKIEKSLNIRLHKLNFFKEEVEERFETFQDSLVDYISNYCLLEHLVNCTQWVTESQNKNITQVIKKITQFKEPF